MRGLLVFVVLCTSVCGQGLERLLDEFEGSTSRNRQDNLPFVNAFCGACNTYAFCCSSSSQTDSNGWGWEQQQSCIVRGTTAAREQCNDAGTSNSGGRSNSGGSGCGSCSSYPFCCKASSQTSNDGWGWEQERSCIVRGTTAAREKCSDVSGGGGGGGGGFNPNPRCPANVDCGCFLKPGLGKRKHYLKSLGADRSFLASAMMETEDMTTNYAWGDNKREDWFNAGMAKQNWGQSRRCYPPWRKYGPEQYKRMDVMNKDPKIDIKVYETCRRAKGKVGFLREHRGRCPGLSNSAVTADQDRFIAVYDWTFDMLKNHEDDDVRCWASVPAC